jgi:hypothetical protein
MKRGHPESCYTSVRAALNQRKEFDMNTLLALTLFLLISAVNIVYASFAEWLLHRYVMHRPVGWFTYPYKAHALTHHGMFSGYEYHLTTQSKDKVRMAWWNGPVIVALGVIPFFTITIIFHLYGWRPGAWMIFGSAVFVSAAYFATYEYLHWCMHVPKGRWFETTQMFRRLNGHHILHHRFPDKNFNVVLPLADYLLKTLVVRSPVRFAQVRGPSVPDLQPLSV